MIEQLLETSMEPQATEATPEVVENPQSEQSEGSKEKSFANSTQDKPRPKPEKMRSIEELSKSPTDITKDEARLIREKVEGRKAPEKVSPPKVDEAKGEPKSKTNDSQPSAKDAENDDQGEDDIDGDGELYKTIGPHVKTGDKAEAIKSIKNLQHELGRRGEIVNHLKNYGLDSKEKVSEALERMVNIDSAVEEHLKTPEGIEKLKSHYGIKPGQNSPAPQQSSEQGSPDVETFMRDIQDGEFIDGARLKKMLPSLMNHISKGFEEKYGAKVSEIEGINKNFQTFMGAALNQNKFKTELAGAFQDIGTISKDYGQYEPSFVLSESPEKIWAESIDPKTRKVFENPHPEFNKLKSIYKMVKESKDKGYPSIRAFIAEKLMTGGKLSEIQNEARRDTTQKFIEAKAKSLQPGLGSKVSPKSGLIIPRSVSELKAMSKEDQARFRNSVRRGEVKTK